jgi:hypothetical protein
MIKTFALALLLAACGGKQSSNTSSAGGAPPPNQDTTSDHMNIDGGSPAMPGGDTSGSAMAPDK